MRLSGAVLDESEELKQPLLQDVELVEECLDMEHQVAVPSDLGLTIGEPAHVKLDVPHCVERGLNLGQMVNQALMVVLAPRPPSGWRGRAEVEDVLRTSSIRSCDFFFDFSQRTMSGRRSFASAAWNLSSPLKEDSLSCASSRSYLILR